MLSEIVFLEYKILYFSIVTLTAYMIVKWATQNAINVRGVFIILMLIATCVECAEYLFTRGISIQTVEVTSVTFGVSIILCCIALGVSPLVTMRKIIAEFQAGKNERLKGKLSNNDLSRLVFAVPMAASFFITFNIVVGEKFELFIYSLLF